MKIIALCILTSLIFSSQQINIIKNKFEPCPYRTEYYQAKHNKINNKLKLIEECQNLIAKDQRLRGAETEIINDIENILMLSVIVENCSLMRDEIDSTVIETIIIVLTHNVSYFNKYFNTNLFDFVIKNRCSTSQKKLIIEKLYRDLFGEYYNNSKTRNQPVTERIEIMKERISGVIDTTLNLNELCNAVDSFLNRQMLFNEGIKEGVWGDSEIKITIRKRSNGTFYMTKTYFDFAFPIKQELVRISENKFRLNNEYTTRIWTIKNNETLGLSSTVDSWNQNYFPYNEP